MPDDTVTLESAAPPEVQARAEKMGWIPPTRYRGEPERFVDAEEYIARGEQVLPIVRAQNTKLQAEIDRMREEGAKTAAALAAAQKAIEEIEERHSVATVKAVEESKRALKAQLKAAHEAGDHEAIAEITGLMIDLNAASEKPPEKKEPPKVESAPAAPVPPELKAWNAANPWFGTDRRKTALALGIAQELRDAGTTLTGVDFFEKVREEVEATLGERKADSKVEPNRGGSGATGGGGSKSYAALPADAKVACDADAKNFVGPTKRYKTQDEWRKRYAELYFGE